MNFRRSISWVLGVATLLASAGPVLSASTDRAGVAGQENPYDSIIDRNVFRLNPPPPPPAKEVEKPVEVPKVMLTGFLKIGNATRVLFAIPPKTAKDAYTYFDLAPEESQNGVKLVRINPEAESVEVVNSGTSMTLSVKENSLNSKGAPGAPAPGVETHRLPGFPTPQPINAPPPPQQANAGGPIIIGGGAGTSENSDFAANGGVAPANNSGIYSGGRVASYGNGASGGNVSYGNAGAVGNTSYGNGNSGGVSVSGGANYAANGGNNYGNGAGGTQPNLNLGNLFNNSGGSKTPNWPPIVQAPPEVQAISLATAGPPPPPGFSADELANQAGGGTGANSGPPQIPQYVPRTHR